MTGSRGSATAKSNRSGGSNGSSRTPVRSVARGISATADYDHPVVPSPSSFSVEVNPRTVLYAADGTPLVRGIGFRHE